MTSTTKKVLVGGGLALGVAGLVYALTRPAQATSGGGAKNGGTTNGTKGGGQGGGTTQGGNGGTTPPARNLLDSAIAAIKNANDLWANYINTQNMVKEGTLDQASETQAATLAQNSWNSAYDWMVAAVRGDQVGSGPLADAAKAAVKTADQIWAAWVAGQNGLNSNALAQAVDQNRPITFNVMLAAVQAAAAAPDYTKAFQSLFNQ